MNIDSVLEKQKAGSTTIQTLIFSKEKFTRTQATAWASSHNFKSSDVDETGNSYRLRQKPPGNFQPNSYRTISLTDGVQAVIGKLKQTKKSLEGNTIMENIENKTPDKGLFTAFIPIKLDSSGKPDIIEKTIGEGQKGKFIVGEASNHSVDKVNDRIGKAFLKKMADTVKGLNVFVEHEHHIDKTIGYISETSMPSDESVVVETALEDEKENALVKSIMNKMKHGTRLFYSVGGRVTKIAKTFVKDLNKTINEVVDGEIFEISLTALPEGNVGFVNAITKSMSEFLKSVDEGSTVENATEEHIIKTLDEMVQSSGIKEELHDMFWAFRDAVGQITHNTDLTPEQKKDKIISLSSEYAGKVETLSTVLADLTVKIEEQLT